MIAPRGRASSGLSNGGAFSVRPGGGCSTLALAMSRRRAMWAVTAPPEGACGRLGCPRLLACRYPVAKGKEGCCNAHQATFQANMCRV